MYGALIAGLSPACSEHLFGFSFFGFCLLPYFFSFFFSLFFFVVLFILSVSVTYGGHGNWIGDGIRGTWPDVGAAWIRGLWGIRGYLDVHWEART